MRRPRHRLATFVVLACTIALGVPAAALAKGEAMGVNVDSRATDVRAGRPWDLTFTVVAAPAAQIWRDPAVWIENRGPDDPVAFFDAHRTGRPGEYRARVTFPEAGRWTYTVGERYGRFFDFGPVSVRAASGAGGSALLGATPLAALLALCLAAGCAAVARRRRMRDE